MAAGGAADCADLLLIVGADPNPHTREGRGPLSLAAGPGTAETIATRGGACHVPAQETDLRFTVTGLPAAEAVSERQWWET
jgi:predicted nicotinamide N-methyase